MINKHGWERKKLGEMCEVFNGGTPDTTKKEFWDGSILWITPKDMGRMKSIYVDDTERKITEAGLKNSSARILPINSIVISSRAPIGHLAINTKPICTNQGCKGLVPKDELNTQYLYYFLKDSVQLLNDLGTGATFKEISGTKLGNVKIPIPPLPTQHQIVSELDALSDIITKKKQQLEELDKLAQATFYDMFGDPVSNEKGLTVKTLGEICEITSSKRIYAEEYQQDGIPFYRSKEIIEKGKKKTISLELFISNERYNEIKNKFGIPEIGDILMTAVGTIGEIWVVDSNAPFYFKDGNIVWLKMNKSNNSTYFLFVLGLLVKEYKTKMAVGAAYSALTIVNLKNMKVVYPVLEVQNQFAIKIESIEKQKELINKSIADVQQLFDYTMDKYFN
jgi:type I restriction enzyme S subunit